MEIHGFEIESNFKILSNLYLALFSIHPLVLGDSERGIERRVTSVGEERNLAHGFDLAPVAFRLVIDGKFSVFLEHFELAVFAAYVEGIDVSEDTVDRATEVGTNINL